MMDLVMNEFKLPPFLSILGSTKHSVADFQKSTSLFVDACSGKLPYAMREAFIGMKMGQDQAVFAKLLTRTQDATNMLRLGREGKIPILVIGCKLDKLVNPDALRKFYGENSWRDLKMIELEEADHVPWVSQPDGFRDAILDWVESASSLLLT
ncbi:hypothetical protein C8J56DRAFT_1081748 [Mycena floridula]|nr:hypothetical protein C8J56DRAFT_1081748 [Mycena floridula]